jgi:hypothetical protein
VPGVQVEGDLQNEDLSRSFFSGCATVGENSDGIEILVEPAPRRGEYAEFLLNSITMCPKYTKRARLVKALMEKFNIDRRRAEQVVEDVLTRWVKMHAVKRHPVIKGYYCREK